ncbi:MAG: hypothetical protein AB8H86_32030 [Polyangiales bacterium]
MLVLLALLAVSQASWAQAQCDDGDDGVAVRFFGSGWELPFRERVLVDLRTEFGSRGVDVCVLESVGPAADVTLHWVGTGPVQLHARTGRPGFFLPRVLELRDLPPDSHSWMIAVAAAELLRASGLRREHRLERAGETARDDALPPADVPDAEALPQPVADSTTDSTTASTISADDAGETSAEGGALEWSLSVLGSAEYFGGGVRLFGGALALRFGGARYGLETEVGFGVALSESGRLGTVDTRAGWLSVAAGVELVRASKVHLRLQGGPRVFLVEFQGSGQGPLVFQNVVRPALSLAAGTILGVELGAFRLRAQVEIGGVVIGAGATEDGEIVAAIEGVVLRALLGAGAAW